MKSSGPRQGGRSGALLQPHDAMVEAVRAELQHSMGVDPVRMKDLGAKLGVHHRTLQRRLLEQGTTFKELLDGVRREMAEVFLREQGFSIADSTFLLGFSSVDAFYRAFRRWHGTTPAAYRGRIFGPADGRPAS